MHAFLLYSILLLCSFHTHATYIITGNDSNEPQGFTEPIMSKAYDEQSGNFFVGLAAGADTYAIARATRPNFVDTQAFIPLATEYSGLDQQITNQAIEFLALSPQLEMLPLVHAVTQNTSGPFSQNFFYTIKGDGLSAIESISLNDAAQMLTSGIVNIAASPTHVYAAVNPTQDASMSMLDCFGDPQSGISVSAVQCADNKITIDTKDATTGLDGNKAVELTGALDAVKGTGAGGDATILTDTANKNMVDLFYDKPLGLLYIALRVESGSGMDDIAKAIVIGRPDQHNINKLDLTEIAPDTVIDNVVTSQHHIFVQGASDTVSINKVRVLHTTTGPSYLIVNGGNGTIDQVGNQVWAFPLVDKPSDQTIHGTIADKDSDLENCKFVTAATMPSQLPGFTPPTQDTSAQVGASELPMLPSDAIFDLQVINDTVYISIDKAPSATNDSGVFFSQAQFDQSGKIIRWSPWTKRAVPFNAFPGEVLPGNMAHNGCVSFFAVDAQTGNVWVVDGATRRVVGVTAWSTGVLENGLIQQVSDRITCSALSVLDLDQATRGFLDATTERYALFGGGGTVIFTRVSQAHDISNINSPQTVIQDFTTPDNIYETEIPGCVTSLEYSRRLDSELARNYFFAGTENGLFVFTDSNGNGFTASALSTLDQAPFINRQWVPVTNIPGSIIALHSSQVDPVTNNGVLYILATEFMNNGSQSTLYAVPYESTVSAMFAPANIRILAQSGVDDFINVPSFTGFQVVLTGQKYESSTIVDEPNREQIILSTNNGLYASHANQMLLAQGIVDATDQATANWQHITDSAHTAYLGISGASIPVLHTVWPFSLEDNKFATFERGAIHQISAAGDSTGDNALINTFKPVPFTARNADATFLTFDPITFMWSDGARRFFIVNQVNQNPGQNEIAVVPYEPYRWGLTSPQLLTYPGLLAINHFYWVKEIGATGLVLAGTNQGLIGLE